MNRKLKLALISYASEKGFALPVVIGMGLIMTLIGMTMIMRSQGDQVTAISQKETAQSLAIAEGGVTRTLSKLNKSNNSFLLKLDYDPINSNTGKQYLGEDGKPNSGDEKGIKKDEWSDPSETPPCYSSSKIEEILAGTIGDKNKKNYRVKAYRYHENSKEGTLLVEGKDSSSKSWLRVSVPVRKNNNNSGFPGLLAKNSISIGNNDVIGENGNIICQNCEPSGGWECNASQPTQASLNDAIEKKKNSRIDGEILVGNHPLPEDLFKTSDSASNVHDVGAI